MQLQFKNIDRRKEKNWRSRRGEVWPIVEVDRRLLKIKERRMRKISVEQWVSWSEEIHDHQDLV